MQGRPARDREEKGEEEGAEKESDDRRGEGEEEQQWKGGGVGLQLTLDPKVRLEPSPPNSCENPRSF